MKAKLPIIYLNFWGLWPVKLGSVAVRERALQAKGSGSILDWKFIFFDKEEFLYQLKNV